MSGLFDPTAHIRDSVGGGALPGPRGELAFSWTENADEELWEVHVGRFDLHGEHIPGGWVLGVERPYDMTHLAWREGTADGSEVRFGRIGMCQ
jgi:hypothetical protein